MNDLTIPVSTAKEWTKTWQNMNQECAKAYLVPVSDLLDAFIEMGLASKTENGILISNLKPNDAVRCYLATNPNPNERSKAQGYGNKMYIVGTTFEKGIYKDIIEGETEASIASESLDGTGIFDFTKPCPTNCDIDSPLYN